MNKLSLQNKIFLILVLPILTIIFLSTNILLNKIEQKNSILKTKEYLQLCIFSSNLLSKLQEEREYSLIFLENYGKKYENELINIRLKSDKKLEKLNNFIATLEEPKILSKIENLQKQLSKISFIRVKINKISISDGALINYYNEVIHSILIYIDEISSYSNDGILSKKLQAYISVVNTTEKASKERTVVRKIFEKQQLSNDDYFKFSSLFASQETFLELFKSVANKEQIELLNKQFECKNCKEIKRFRNLIFNKNRKNQILYKIENEAGYGGLIHNYKDYILSGDIKYMNKIQKYHTSISRNINKYKRIKGTTIEEKKLLKVIKEVFDEYLSSSLDIMEAYEQNKSILEINSNIKIDKRKAKIALEKLLNNIYGADSKNGLKFHQKE